jgi:hypothetical protein
MTHHLSRKQFLSLGVFGGLGFLGGACTLDDVPPADKGGSSGSGGSGAGGTPTTTNATVGTSGSTAVGSGGSAGSGSGGSAGSAGSGGSSAGNGGAGGSSAGSAGKGGSGGSAGTGGSADAGKGGSGGSGGSKDGGAQDGGGMCTGMIVANVSLNHNAAGNGPHGLVIPAADITAGTPKTYATTPVMGMIAQGHMHFVQLTAMDFMNLRAGMTVKKHSCSGGDHEYVLKCGGTTDMGVAPVGCADECGGMMTNPCPGSL